MPVRHHISGLRTGHSLRDPEPKVRRTMFASRPRTTMVVARCWANLPTTLPLCSIFRRLPLPLHCPTRAPTVADSTNAPCVSLAFSATPNNRNHLAPSTCSQRGAYSLTNRLPCSHSLDTAKCFNSMICQQIPSTPKRTPDQTVVLLKSGGRRGHFGCVTRCR